MHHPKIRDWALKWIPQPVLAAAEADNAEAGLDLCPGVFVDSVFC
jgi:hypothetical protein